MRTLKTIFVVLLLIRHALVWAGQDEAVAAYRRGDFAAALKEFRALAERGNSSAQLSMGWMFYEGRGVPRDDEEAVKWFRKAADQGLAQSQFALGAMFHLGAGVVQDDTEAAKWFRKAADQGVDTAQYELGVSYAEGRGVPQDYVQAYKWFNLAGVRGNNDATRKRDSVSRDMTPAQIAEARRLASAWIKQHQ
jgi:TPR repeat protein